MQYFRLELGGDRKLPRVNERMGFDFLSRHKTTKNFQKMAFEDNDLDLATFLAGEDMFSTEWDFTFPAVGSKRGFDAMSESTPFWTVNKEQCMGIGEPSDPQNSVALARDSADTVEGTSGATVGPVVQEDASAGVPVETHAADPRRRPEHAEHAMLEESIVLGEKPRAAHGPESHLDQPVMPTLTGSVLDVVPVVDGKEIERWKTLFEPQKISLKYGIQTYEQIMENLEESMIKCPLREYQGVNTLNQKARRALVRRSESSRIWHEVSGSTTGRIAKWAPPHQVMIMTYIQEGICPNFMWTFAQSLHYPGSELIRPWSFLLEVGNVTCHVCQHFQRPHCRHSCNYDHHLDAIWGRHTVKVDKVGAETFTSLLGLDT